MNSIHDDAALERIRSHLRIEPDHLRRLRNAFYKKRHSAEEALRQIAAPQRTAFGGEIDFHALELRSRHDSQVDGASKLLFAPHQPEAQARFSNPSRALRVGIDELIETVILRIASGRTSLCVSSQVGCAVRCRFCATGQMGRAVNLTCAEILDQVIQANRLLLAEGRAVRNVVFMGMGEPLHNETEVHKTLAALLSPRRFDLSPAHVLVSTVGIPDAMVRFAERFPQAGLAVSLHAARQEQRERLIPLARRYPLCELRKAMDQVVSLQRRPLMIEYLLLDGLNDTDQDVRELIAYLRGLPVHVNLIPYNPIRDAVGLVGTPPERRRAFGEALTAAGFTVTVRYSLGADVAAACGQLAQLHSSAALA